MAKRTKKQTPERVTPKEMRRRNRVQEEQRKLIIGAVAVIVAIVAILAVGFYQENIAVARAPVAVVDGKEIKVKEYQELVNYQRFNLITSLGGAANPQALVSYLRDQLPLIVLDQIIDQVFIERKAAEEGVTVTDEEVQAEIERRFGLGLDSPSAANEAGDVVTDTTASATSQDTFEERFSSYIEALKEQTGLSEQDYREIVRDELLRNKVRDLIAADVPAQASQVHARHILVDSEEKALQVRQRLLNGEDFEAVAQEVSSDSTVDLGWFGRGMMVPEFEEAAFNLPVGEISEPVKTDFGYHIIEVLEKDDNRELSATELEQAQQQAFSRWQQEQRANADIQRFWTPEMVPELPPNLANLPPAAPLPPTAPAQNTSP